MRKEIAKSYEPKEVEQKWYTLWEERGYFRADEESTNPPFSIAMPPPNVTGSLHMGHALNMTLQDILTRWERMKGSNVLWLPGTDHAGIATQNVVERQLAEQGKKRTDLGREEFERVVWQWKETAETNILSQIRKLGCSCDWSRQRFTLDEGLSRAVREVFVQLYEEGLIYRGEYLVNWCPRCRTAISDLEVEFKPSQGKLWHIRYPIKGTEEYLVVATTRPETMLGDTAVAVHPEDERYLHFHDRTAILPLMNREIPIITDSFVEKEFGTGAVKVTPGHDPNDFEMGRRHSLPIVKVIGEEGEMTEEAGEFSGLDRYQARKQVIAELERQNLLVKVEPHANNVGGCQRCGTVVEPLVSTQWFVKVKPLADVAIRAVQKKETVFVPENYEKIFFEWMSNIHDWCISRQLWWGHRIPAWFCESCGELTVSRQDVEVCEHCQAHDLVQESDVLDTWFSSALWPFSTLGWPDETKELSTYYPTSTLVTGFDIIFFWVARMMMMGLRFRGEVPFRRVYINGLVRDEKGQKMSKSRGNIIDPLELIDQYGSDAVRFTVAVSAVPGTDIPFSISRMAGYRAFCNKIWNAGRFLLLNLETSSPVSEDDIEALRQGSGLELEHRWILGRLQQVVAGTDHNLEKFLLHEASHDLYHFFWHELCDWYIELIKADLGSSSTKANGSTVIATFVLETSLRLLHPFIPFLTEEMWQLLPHEGETIMRAPYPRSRADWIDEEAISQMEQLQELITAIRTARAENNIAPSKKLPAQLIPREEAQSFLQSQQHQLQNLCRLDPIEFSPIQKDKGLRVGGVSRLAEFSLELDGAVDLEAERERIGRQLRKLEQELERIEAKLGNSAFVQKAPAPVVEATRLRQHETEDQLRKLQETLNELSQP